MIEIKGLSKTYNKGKENEVYALINVDLRIEDGQMIAITGPSGSGKSTLLNILSGNLKYDKGMYLYDNMEIGKLNDKKLSKFKNSEIGVVFQDNLLMESNSVIENTELPLLFDRNISRKKRQELSYSALRKVNMIEYKDRPAKKLSGGQKQRVAISRAIVNSPSVLLADEPTGSLDSGNKRQIMQLFSEINKSGTTVIIVTHDEYVAKFCNILISIVDGKIVEK